MSIDGSSVTDSTGLPVPDARTVSVFEDSSPDVSVPAGATTPVLNSEGGIASPQPGQTLADDIVLANQVMPWVDLGALYIPESRPMMRPELIGTVSALVVKTPIGPKQVQGDSDGHFLMGEGSAVILNKVWPAGVTDYIETLQITPDTRSCLIFITAGPIPNYVQLAGATTLWQSPQTEFVFPPGTVMAYRETDAGVDLAWTLRVNYPVAPTSPLHVVVRRLSNRAYQMVQAIQNSAWTVGFSNPQIRDTQNADTLSAAGTATAPAVGTDIVSLSPGQVGSFRIIAQCGYGATGDAAHNMILLKNTTTIRRLLFPGGNQASGVPIIIPRISLIGTDVIRIRPIAAGVAGSIYAASLDLQQLV